VVYTQNSSDAFRRLRRECGQKFRTEILNLKTAKEPEKNIGSNCILHNRQLIFSPKKPYDLAAEPRTRGEAGLTCSNWWSLYQKVRTHFKQNPD